MKSVYLAAEFVGIEFVQDSLLYLPLWGRYEQQLFFLFSSCFPECGNADTFLITIL